MWALAVLVCECSELLRSPPHGSSCRTDPQGIRPRGHPTGTYGQRLRVALCHWWTAIRENCRFMEPEKDARGWPDRLEHAYRPPGLCHELWRIVCDSPGRWRGRGGDT